MEKNTPKNEIKQFVSTLKKHGYENGCSLVWVNDDNGDEFYFH